MIPTRPRLRTKSVRNIFISTFVIIWLGVFHYESLRAGYLNPLFKRELPKIKFLFPPAGWIMFYRVDRGFGFTEVYGVKNGQIQKIDPHEIFQTRTIMFDNIHRNILSTVADQRYAGTFCPFLKRKFPYFDAFNVVTVYYPDLVKERFERMQRVQYVCP